MATIDEIARIAEAENDQQARRIAEAFMRYVQTVKDTFPIGLAEELLREGRLDELADLVAPDDDNALAVAMAGAIIAGAGIAARTNGLPVDAMRPGLSEYRAQILGDLNRNMREEARKLVLDMASRGATAREIRDSIGLTAQQRTAIDNYRRALEEQDVSALDRELRDRRSDARIRRTFRDGEGLPKSRIDALVDQYTRKQIIHRARVIGETESTKALNGGAARVAEQAQEDGRDVKMYWRTQGDKKVRNAHRQIPGMNRAGVRPGEVFVTPLGPLRFPGDPNGTAANTIGCRCVLVVRARG